MAQKNSIGEVGSKCFLVNSEQLLLLCMSALDGLIGYWWVALVFLVYAGYSALGDPGKVAAPDLNQRYCRAESWEDCGERRNDYDNVVVWQMFLVGARRGVQVILHERHLPPSNWHIPPEAIFTASMAENPTIIASIWILPTCTQHAHLQLYVTFQPHFLKALASLLHHAVKSIVSTSIPISFNAFVDK